MGADVDLRRPRSTMMALRRSDRVLVMMKERSVCWFSSVWMHAIEWPSTAGWNNRRAHTSTRNSGVSRHPFRHNRAVSLIQIKYGHGSSRRQQELAVERVNAAKT